MNSTKRDRPTLALCMIVRDEADRLPTCLESVSKHVDEIHITDTGSKDDTIEVARRFGAHVRHFDWCDHFAAARNASIRDIRSDWILLMDADDVFPDVDSAVLNRALSMPGCCGLLCRYQIQDGFTPGPTLRFFRNGLGIKFEGRIHETLQIARQVALGWEIAELPILVRHTGYTQQSIPAKARRNLPLLIREWNDLSNHPATFQRVNVGRQLAAALRSLDQSSASESVTRALLDEIDWSAASPIPEWMVRPLGILIELEEQRGDWASLWEAFDRWAPRFGCVPLFWLYHGIVAFRSRHFQEALTALTKLENHFKERELETPVPVDYTGLELLHLIGQCCLQLTDYAAARHYFARCIAASPTNKEFKVKMRLAEALADRCGSIRVQTNP